MEENGRRSDMQLKMAKKISQLTKVIFHLNTVNEDAHLEKNTMRSQHARELDELIADASKETDALHATLTDHRDQLNLVAERDQATHKLEEEKAAGLEELAQLKRELLARDEAVVGDYQDTIGALHEEMTAVKAQSQEAKRRFAETLERLQANGNHQAENAASNMRTLREKHQSEVDDLVKTSNAKYHQMLAEQMEAHDLLREQMQSREEAARDAAREGFEQEAGRLRAELQAEHQTTMLSQEKDFELKLKGCRDAMIAKLDKSGEAYDGIAQELSVVQGQLGAAQLAAADAERARIEGASALSDARTEIIRLTDEADRHLQSARSSAGHVESELRSARVRMQSLEAQIATLEGERDQASRAVMQAGEDKRRVEAAHAAFAQKMTEEMCSRDGQLAALNGQIDALKKRLSEQVLAGQKESAQIAAAHQELRQENTKLGEDLGRARAEIGELGRAAEVTASGLDDERRAMERRLHDEEKLWRQTFEDRESALERRYAVAAEAALLQAAEAQRVALASAATESRLREDALKKNAAEAATVATQALQNAAAEHARVSKAAREEAAREQNECTRAREAAERELANIQEQTSGDFQKAQSEASRLSKEVGVLKAQIDKTGTENKRWRTTCQELKVQVEDLRREIEDCKAAAKRHLEAETTRIDVLWRTRLSDATAEAATQLEARNVEVAQRRADDATKHGQEIAALRSSLEEVHVARVATFERELDAMRVRAVEAASEAERRQLADEVVREALSQQSEDCITKLREENAAAIERLEEDLRRQLEDQHKELTSKHAEELARNAESHEIQNQNMAAQHSDVLNAVRDAHRSALEAADLAMEEKVSKTTAAAASEKAKSLKDLRLDLSSEKDAAVQRLHEDFNAERISLKDELTTANGNLLEKSSRCMELEKDLSHRKEDLRLAKLDADAKLSEASAREAAALTALQQDHARETEVLREGHDSEKCNMRSSMQQEYDILENDFIALQERWETRESRPEDLERIRHLEVQMVDKDKLVKKTMEEMVYFKRELLNREENFNKRFNQNVNVGVMQVIKPKDGKPNGKRPLGGKTLKKGAGPLFPTVPPAPAR